MWKPATRHLPHPQYSPPEGTKRVGRFSLQIESPLRNTGPQKGLKVMQLTTLPCPCRSSHLHLIARRVTIGRRNDPKLQERRGRADLPTRRLAEISFHRKACAAQAFAVG